MTQTHVLQETGFYSLVQYRPDELRLETATLGVLLFAPASRVVLSRTAKNLRRVSSFFKGDDFDSARLLAMLESIEERVRVVGEQWRDEHDLRRFVSLRANQVVLTEPRATLVDDPESTLDRLFRRAVVEEPRSPRSAPAFQRLHNLMAGAVINGRAEQDVAVELPLANRFTAPYAYQNGFRNLVKPFRFNPHKKRASTEIEKLAVESKEVSALEGPQGQRQRVLLVAKPDDVEKAQLSWEEAKQFLERYEARVESSEDLERIRLELAAAPH